MKHALILSAAMLGLAACGGADNGGDAPDPAAPETETGPEAASGSETDAPEADLSDASSEAGSDTPEATQTSFRDDCLVIANDVEGQKDIAEMGTDADGFCGCAERFVEAMTPEDQESARATMKAVADGMNETGNDTETVVGGMMSDAMAKGDDPDAQATIEGVKLVGGMIDDIDASFSDTGSCTVETPDGD